MVVFNSVTPSAQWPARGSNKPPRLFVFVRAARALMLRFLLTGEVHETQAWQKQSWGGGEEPLWDML